MSAELESKPQPYRVLARKYRPQNFSELIGQDTLVRTLKNAIESGRVAHAFMLTGVRGVGKTTTARIIAKALNYTGPDGNAGPTTGSTDDCALCRAIAEDRHPDIIEMDAASRTGVDDIRDILDGVRYAPTEARYKIYIIDEVHMLSKNAFNALLKTLEEPPPHVKFIFATTEIRKVPITVLSRCQRFDLRRVDAATLSTHFKSICEKENFTIEDEALSLIARAADGSVRDGLSLLDQAMALSGDSITGAQIKDMLGLADRARSLDLLENVLAGKTAEALDIVDDLYRSGTAPIVLIQDLLDLTHVMTRLKAVPGTADMAQAMATDEIARATDIAGKVSMPALGKTWQILLKGLGEVQTAPTPQNAAEMVIIRLMYAANLPDPADLIKALEGAPQGGHTPPPPPSAPPPSGGGGNRSSTSSGSSAGLATAHHPQTDSAPVAQTSVNTLEDVIAVLEHANEHLLASQVYQFVHLVKLKNGKIEVRLDELAPPKLAQDLGAKLSQSAGQRWMVSISGAAGQPTLAEKAEAARQEQYNNVLHMPIIQDIIRVFPDAELTDIKKIEKPQRNT